MGISALSTTLYAEVACVKADVKRVLQLRADSKSSSLSILPNAFSPLSSTTTLPSVGALEKKESATAATALSVIFLSNFFFFFFFYFVFSSHFFLIFFFLT